VYKHPVFLKDLTRFPQSVKSRATLEVTELKVKQDLTASLQVTIQGPNL